MSSPSTDEVRVGAILRNTYEIIALIGEGGMGSVFAAKHVRLPKQVAVKVLKTDLSLSGEVVARFRREAEIASRLGHPNIVEVLDFDTLPGGTPFLVLEFLKGESLAGRLARGPMSWDDTRAIALQVGSALFAAHAAGVVHRDLKPDNIFLLKGDSTGASVYRSKLLDFGISKLTGSGATLQTQDAILMGTPQYMSPEQALGKNSGIDARSDVFALGCIYYEMLAGRSAFSGEGIAQVIYRIVHEPPQALTELVGSLPPHVWPAIERALAKGVDARWPDVATFTEALTGTPLREIQETLPTPRPAAMKSGTMQLAALPIPLHPTPAALPNPSQGGAAVGIAPQPSKPAEEIQNAQPILQARPISQPGPTSGTKKPIPWLPIGVGGALFLVLLIGGMISAGNNAKTQPRPDAPVPGNPNYLQYTNAFSKPGNDNAEIPTPTPTPAQPAAIAHLPGGNTNPMIAAGNRWIDLANANHARQSAGFAPKNDDAKQALAAAQNALPTDPALAIQYAQRSLQYERSGQAFAIMTEAACQQQNLMGANAYYASVPRGLKMSVRDHCRKNGIEPH